HEKSPFQLTPVFLLCLVLMLLPCFVLGLLASLSFVAKGKIAGVHHRLQELAEKHETTVWERDALKDLAREREALLAATIKERDQARAQAAEKQVELTGQLKEAQFSAAQARTEKDEVRKACDVLKAEKEALLKTLGAIENSADKRIQESDKRYKEAAK